eukprot:COSAG02_NODE_484_length_21389_cov_9.202583_14_plen_81_part_00
MGLKKSGIYVIIRLEQRRYAAERSFGAAAVTRQIRSTRVASLDTRVSAVLRHVCAETAQLRGGGGGGGFEGCRGVVIEVC